jgi:O-acetyl-ADP-ribose deacetylase (regulator of RNase III)
MKASIKFGDILTADGIVIQGCNAQGAMNSGLAKNIRDKWPEIFVPYSNFINKNKGKNIMGEIIPFASSSPPFAIIMNCITQEFYGRDHNTKYVSYEAIDKAFRNVYAWIKESRHLQEDLCINYPLIGAGLANGDWAIISAIIDKVAEEEDPTGTVRRILWIKE